MPTTMLSDEALTWYAVEAAATGRRIDRLRAYMIRRAKRRDKAHRELTVPSNDATFAARSEQLDAMVLNLLIHADALDQRLYTYDEKPEP
ncbi:hypothetical protein KZX46_21730 (plasmid) [Polymorphobacter sp. PAMC 29334]|uniref:hypothetical protein n=1 Tax=Polymorphobacter sp. PAMC 29334 TaxID=2862331 RepID=UPI001C77626E|nr:hypothetical protein [Polymorphobacter sp. PAMC 29334]QYE37256.1 hypothetical protein KZX46_21730 [Polymorphobacter sp. PAMC 29334]